MQGGNIYRATQRRLQVHKKCDAPLRCSAKNEYPEKYWGGEGGNLVCSRCPFVARSHRLYPFLLFFLGVNLLCQRYFLLWPNFCAFWLLSSQLIAGGGKPSGPLSARPLRRQPQPRRRRWLIIRQFWYCRVKND